MPDWLKDHRLLVEWVGIVSVVLSVGSLILIPMLVTKIPADYFARRKAPQHPYAQSHPFLRMLYHVVKAGLGAVLVILGIGMLVLPGQGVLTILVGVILLEFPGKRAFELTLVRQKRIHAALDWIRRKAGKPPLVVMPVRDRHTKAEDESSDAS